MLVAIRDNIAALKKAGRCQEAGNAAAITKSPWGGMSPLTPSVSG
jgi:hypothetical protein